MSTSTSFYKNIDDYIISLPKNIRDSLDELRRVIKESAPKAEETITWGDAYI